MTDTVNFQEQYRGNPNLKRVGQSIQWTPEMIKEFSKCADDPVYFGEKYFHIVTEDGRHPITMYNYQVDLINDFVDHRNVIAEMARQSGKTTTVTVFALWYILFQEHKTIALLANKAETAREVLGRIQLAYEQLPVWMQQGVREWNKGSFVLENGSRILAASTSANSIRGYSINCLIIDEAAHIENWEEFFTATYPTISAGKRTKIILISTVKGMNHFYEIAENARKQLNNYRMHSISWEDVPGRDEEWKNNTLAGMNFNHEKFAQEYENEYLGSSGTLISGWKLKELNSCRQDPVHRNAGVYQYEKPKKDHRYFVVADVSRGKGLDYSAFQVIDCTEQPYRQVCIFRDNTTAPMDYAEIIHRMARMYNNAYTLIENNDIGSSICDYIYHDFEYENVIQTENAGRAGKRATFGFGKGGNELGIRTTKVVKQIGASMIKMCIEQNVLEIIDKATIDEINTFIKKGDNYCAEPGKTDDLMMCLVLFGWLTGTDFFKEATDANFNMSLREKDDEQMMADLLPFGIYDDHQWPESMDNIHDDPYSLNYDPFGDPYDRNEGF